MLRVVFAILLALTAVCTKPGLAQAEEKYYVILFASQLPSNAPRSSHTWATFVKVTQDERADGDEPDTSPVTISWLPATGVIPPVMAVRGRNFGLEETLQWARAQGTRVSAFGPIAIKKELYDLARTRKVALDAGTISYKMLDVGVRPASATNCIHAVSDVVPGTLLTTGTARGEAATLLVARHLRPFMVRPGETHPQVLDLLRLPKGAANFRALE